MSIPISSFINLLNIFLSGDGQALGYLFALAIIVVTFLVALVVPIIIILLLGLLIVLITLGIISTSLISGLYQKSIEKGFKAFVILMSIFICCIISEIFFLLIHNIYGLWSFNISLIIGIIPGILSGWFIGSVMFGTLKRIIKFIKDKYHK